MSVILPIEADTPEDLAHKISQRLKGAIKGHLAQAFEPDRQKTMRLFSATEAAELLNTTPQNLRRCHNEGILPEASEIRTGGRRYYSAQEIWDHRQTLEKHGKRAGHYLPWRREGENLQVLQMMNFKGGSAKTTATLHIAHYLVLHGYRVLLVDLDPQGSLTGMCGINPYADDGEPSTYDAITTEDARPMAEVIRPTFLPGLYLSKSDLELSEYEHEAHVPGALPHTRLRDAIAQVQGDFDIVLIDSPPNLGMTTLAGMGAATSIIVPMTPSMMDVESTAKFLEQASAYMDVIRKSGDGLEYDIFHFLMTRDNKTDPPAQELITFMRQLFFDRILQSTFLQSSAVTDATSINQSIYELDKATTTPKTYNRARDNVDSLGKEIRGMVDHIWGRG